MDEEEMAQVPKTIKDYVSLAGGKVSLDDLICDFKEAYKTGIPYEGFGYPDLHSFLHSIKGITVEKLKDDFYLLSNPQKKSHENLTKDQLDDVSNISVQLTNNLIIADRTGKRKVTLKLSSGSTNLNARKSILRKMNLYSSSSSACTVSEINEVQSNEVFLQNYTDPVPQACTNYNNFPNLYSDDISSNDPAAFDSQILFNNCNYYAPQSTSLDTSSSNTLPSYTQSPYHLLLIDFVNKHGLEFPVFETLTNVSSDKSCILFNTILRVGSDNFISPPFNDLSESSIYENLLKTAYESLKNKHEYSFINSQQNVIPNVLNVINSFRNGVTADFVKAAYVQKYKVTPPVNWFDLLASTSSVYIEPLSHQIIIYPCRTFLTPTPYSTSLPDQILPTTDTLNVFISNCVNTSAVWFRILDGDYGKRFQVLLSEMNKHNIRNVVSDVNIVNVGELYACFVEQNWYRAEVLSTRENIAECRLIDTGVKKEFLFRSLFLLNHKFANTPPLAFRCSMAGLKKYDKVNYVSCQLMKMLNNEVVVVKANSAETNNELSAEMYLKNNAFNVSVNKYFLNKIKNELCVPKITQVGELFDVYLLSLDESGEARVKVESGSLQLLKHALDCASELIEQNGKKRSFYASPLSKLHLEKIYLAQMDKSLTRIMIKMLLSEDKASVQCIDTGDYKIIDIRNIVLTDSLPDTLIHISPQCQKVQVLVPDNTTRKMINFMNRTFAQINVQDSTFTIKVIKIEDDPVVQLCKRQNHDEIVPLKTIFFEKSDQVASINFVNNLSNILPDNLCFDLFDNVSSSGVIPKYEMKKGDILKAVVLKTLSPSNFILKIENHPNFAEFMLDLNNYHSIFSSTPVLKIFTGRCYTIHLENNIYYRGLALHVMEDLKTVVVRLVDFAETISVSITAVYHLLPQFHSLPVQTVNARLLNVKPLRGEWTQQDCYRFKEIVYQKILSCVIVDFTDTLCKVILLDDSSRKEIINVMSVLVEERRAVLEEV